MDKSELYQIINGDFEVLEFQDGNEKHSNNDYYSWGLEKVLNRNLQNYYYFSTNTMNIEKKLVPGDAYVNGIKAENITELGRGNYLIPKDLVEPPLKIQIKSVKGILIHFTNLTYSDIVALPNEKVSISIGDYRFSEYTFRQNKPVFKVKNHESGEEVELKGFETFVNNVHPWLRFYMPDYDVDITVEKAVDENKATLSIDKSPIKKYLYSSLKHANIYIDDIVSEAVYSDDYDFGIEDHYLSEGNIIFKKDTPLKVVLNLIKDINLVCVLNGIEYEPTYKEEKKILGSNNILDTVYEYRFDVIFKDEGTLSFKIK